jgi:hypothetical protein
MLRNVWHCANRIHVFVCGCECDPQKAPLGDNFFIYTKYVLENLFKYLNAGKNSQKII